MLSSLLRHLRAVLSRLLRPGRRRATYLWTGAAGDGRWTTPGNWAHVVTGAAGVPAACGHARLPSPDAGPDSPATVQGSASAHADHQC
jgi:hypothetical protein